MKSHTEFNSFGKFLRYMRSEVGLSQRSVAKVIFPKNPHGVKAISKIEGDIQKIQKRQMPLLALVLKCTPEVIQDAHTHFERAKVENPFLLDDQEDVLPYLKHIVTADIPVSTKEVVKILGHYLVLKKWKMPV